MRSALLVLGYALAVAWCAPTGTQASAQYSYSYYRSTMGRYFGGSMMGGGSYGWMMSPAGYRWMTGVVAGSGAHPPGKR